MRPTFFASSWKQILPPVLVLLAGAGGLEIATRSWHINERIFPRPSSVALVLVARQSDLLPALWYTTEAALIGFGSSIVVGISVAVILSSSQWVRRAMYPYMVFFQTVPLVAVAPLLIIWFSPGLPSVSISAFIVSVFPVIANSLAGLLSTDPALLDLFELYGAGPMDRLIKLRLPFALPSIITGLRVSAGLAVIGTVVGEFLVGTIGEDEGLGVKIAAANQYSSLDVVFAAVLLASLLGLTLFAGVNLLEHLMLRRRHASVRSVRSV